MKLKILSVSVLIILLCISVFSSCGTGNEETATVQSTEESAAVHGTDYTYNDAVKATVKETEYVHIVPPVPTEHERSDIEIEPEIVTSSTDATTQKSSSAGSVDEISNGLSLITKTSPVIKGNAATVMIQGSPNEKYTIEFYTDKEIKASYEGLHETSADTNGFASWTFTVEESCESGEHKIIIREKKSDNYIQTSIIVQ